MKTYDLNDMITERDLLEAIEETEKKPDTYDKCCKLSVYTTLLNNLYGEIPTEKQYVSERVIDYDTGSDFSKSVTGKNADQVWRIIEELLDALSIQMPHLYNKFFEKMGEIKKRV